MASGRARDRIGIGDVERVRHLDPGDRRLRRLERGRVAIPQRDGCAARREPLRDREADAGGAAGDHRRPAAEIELVHRTACAGATIT